MMKAFVSLFLASVLIESISASVQTDLCIHPATKNPFDASRVTNYLFIFSMF